MTNKNHQGRSRARDWHDYNKALVRRGSLTLWVEERAVGAWRESRARTGRGRRRTYSDLAIPCALTLREVYGLPLRASEGLVRSVLRLLGADLPVPHYSTLSRRAASLEVKLPRLTRGRCIWRWTRPESNSEVGKEEWKRESGYHRRSLIETALMRLKTVFSDKLKAREWRRQETELRVRCAAMNRMTSLGLPPARVV